MINTARQAKGLPPLDLVFADMILTSDPAAPDDDFSDNSNFSNKMSSTLIRKHLSNASANK